MGRTTLTYISYDLYRELKKEKEIIKMKQRNKPKMKKKKITLYDASQSLLMRIRR